MSPEGCGGASHEGGQGRAFHFGGIVRRSWQAVGNARGCVPGIPGWGKDGVAGDVGGLKAAWVRGERPCGVGVGSSRKTLRDVS